MFAGLFLCFVFRIKIQGVAGAGEELKGEYGKIAGAKSGGIRGDDRRGAGLEVAAEMLGGLQANVAVFVDIGARDDKGAVVEGLVAARGDDDLHVSDPYSCRVSHAGCLSQKIGGGMLEGAAELREDQRIADLDRLSEDFFVSAAEGEGDLFSGAVLVNFFDADGCRHRGNRHRDCHSYR